jgi:hypothetical protein
MKTILFFFLFLFLVAGKQPAYNQAMALRLEDKFRLLKEREPLKGLVKSVEEIVYAVEAKDTLGSINGTKKVYRRMMAKFSEHGHLTSWIEYGGGENVLLRYRSEDASYWRIDSANGGFEEERSTFAKKGDNTEETTRVYKNGKLYSTIFKIFNPLNQLAYLREDEVVHDLGVYERRFIYKNGLLAEETSTFDFDSTRRFTDLYFYSEKGRLDFSFHYHNNRFDRVVGHTYDLQGNEIVREFVYIGAMNLNKAEYSDFDESGNWRKLISSAGNGVYYRYERKIKYY